MVKTLLIDDQVLFLEGLESLLGDLDEDLRFDQAASLAGALEHLARDTPDLILLKLDRSVDSGMDDLRAIRAAAPDSPLAVMGGDDNPYLIDLAMCAGAAGYLPKNCDTFTLLLALRRILAGGTFMPGRFADAAPVGKPVTSVITRQQACRDLSRRQTAILLCAIGGRPNKVIASDFGIAEGTVKAHLSAAFKVLGVRNRTEAVFAAARLGLEPVH